MKGFQFQSHLRNTFLAGAFAAIPLAVTIFILYYIDHQTRGVSKALFGREIPFVGVIVALAGIYVLGLLVTSFLGRIVVGLIDSLLARLPLLRDVYSIWKQVFVTPGGGEGMFAKVVLVPDESGQMSLLGFTSGQPVPGNDQLYCVFIPGVPNPISGRLYFVAKDKIRWLPIGNEEAFKILLSNANYIPPALGEATARHSTTEAGRHGGQLSTERSIES